MELGVFNWNRRRPFLLGGLGALVAILERTGIVQFIYSDADKETMHYKMSKHVATVELCHKRKFADSYYENLGLKPPKQDEPDTNLKK